MKVTAYCGDDTYRHEAWNESTAVRTELPLDVWRREIPTVMALLSKRLVALGCALA